jgi:CBS domain-containing protein
MSALRIVPTVEDVMTPDPIVLRADDPIQHAARVLEEHEISGAPVVDGSGGLVGVLSQTDLLHARATPHLWDRWAALHVRNLMHAPVLTADAFMSVDEAAQLMEQHHVHRLVVVGDDQSTPIGVLSTTDIVRAMVGEGAEVADEDEDEDDDLDDKDDAAGAAEEDRP